MIVKNRYSGKVIFNGSDLSHANLRDSDLSDADLRHANLRGSDLSDSDLSGSYLSDADLSHADLRGSNLRGSDLRDSDLRGSNLRGSDLRYSDLRCADLRGADLDFSAWPLWCWSIGVKLDKRLAVQQLYHVMVNTMDLLPWTDELIDAANTFHRIPEVPKIERKSK